MFSNDVFYFSFQTSAKENKKNNHKIVNEEKMLAHRATVVTEMVNAYPGFHF